MTPYPMAMQMRYLQTLTEVASERNSTIIFPLPLELLRPFLGSAPDGASAPAHNNGRPEQSSPDVKAPVLSATANGVDATPAMAR